MIAGNRPGPIGLKRKPTSVRSPLLKLTRCLLSGVCRAAGLAMNASTNARRTAEPVRALTLRNTQLFNLTGHPAISLPCGKTRDGLPVGLQLVGPHGRTDALVRFALACERLLS